MQEIPSRPAGDPCFENRIFQRFDPVSESGEAIFDTVVNFKSNERLQNRSVFQALFQGSKLA